jgi:hypothetical protein
MIETASHLGLVSDDGLKFAADVPEQFKAAFKPYPGKRVWVTVEEWKELHTPEQRAYWWAVIVRCFMEKMGDKDPNYVHKEVLKMIGHCEVKVNKITGEETKEAMRTRRSSKKAYSERIDSALQLGDENDMQIPAPNSAKAQAMIVTYRRTQKEAETI